MHFYLTFMKNAGKDNKNKIQKDKRQRQKRDCGPASKASRLLKAGPRVLIFKHCLFIGRANFRQLAPEKLMVPEFRFGSIQLS